MIRPHYMTKRVGDDYVLVRVDPIGQVGRWVAGAIGLSLVSRAIRRSGIVGMFGFVAGGACLYHAVTGQNPMDLVCSKSQARHGNESDSPSFPGETKTGQARQVPSDAVEEAAMESFPASDAPAHGAK